MSPRRLISALLEDEIDPLSSPEGEIDVKHLTSQAVAANSLLSGPSITGTYADLARRFEGKRRLRRDGPEESFKVDNNTWLCRDTSSGSISVKFHYTHILTVTPEDSLTVNNGDWQTVTTLARLNNWLPAGWGVYTHKGSWYWTCRGSEETGSPKLKKLWPYSNGDTISADGTLTVRAEPEFKNVRAPRAA